MSGAYSRNKGARGERTLVNIFRDKKITAKRISMMETGGIDKGDVAIEAFGRKELVEVKVGNQVPLFIYTARKSGESLLAMKRDGKDWVICMDLEYFIEHYL